ncbi:hypothetical protein GUJ93_ZPchr0006g44309 [Zizania palustris]|uniref:Uncharacterized protein n=1 Tax=Zizania palustris TaxID=103762 RepID=A0A8J5SJ39_ZIZPA|nr:hypothetical protein GUJ93_ZPchr0006g44309 [Zizania palustris]
MDARALLQIVTAGDSLAPPPQPLTSAHHHPHPRRRRTILPAVDEVSTGSVDPSGLWPHGRGRCRSRRCRCAARRVTQSLAKIESGGLIRTFFNNVDKRELGESDRGNFCLFLSKHHPIEDHLSDDDNGMDFFEILGYCPVHHLIKSWQVSIHPEIVGQGNDKKILQDGGGHDSICIVYLNNGGIRSSTAATLVSTRTPKGTSDDGETICRIILRWIVRSTAARRTPLMNCGTKHA